MRADPKLENRDVLVAFDGTHADRSPEGARGVQVRRRQHHVAYPHGWTLFVHNSSVPAEKRVVKHFLLDERGSRAEFWWLAVRCHRLAG